MCCQLSDSYADACCLKAGSYGMSGTSSGSFQQPTAVANSVCHFCFLRALCINKPTVLLEEATMQTDCDIYVIPRTFTARILPTDQHPTSLVTTFCRKRHILAGVLATTRCKALEARLPPSTVIGPSDTCFRNGQSGPGFANCKQQCAKHMQNWTSIKVCRIS